MADGQQPTTRRSDEPDGAGQTTEENDVTADTGAAAQGTQDAAADTGAETGTSASTGAGTAAAGVALAPGDGGTGPTADTGPAAGTAAGATGAQGIGTGPGRLLLWLYGIFTVAALSRSAVQISMKFHHAPLAYVLSAVAGVVYAVILVALAKGGETARRLAVVCCSAELLGVLTVGTLTVVDSSAFADATVWSYYGAGYLLIPLALPVSGLLWLRRAARTPAQA